MLEIMLEIDWHTEKNTTICGIIQMPSPPRMHKPNATIIFF